MKIIGLTGGIATGKSTTATMLRDRGIPVHDADAVVHRLMAANGAAVQPVIDRFGDSVLASDGSIDRQALGGIVFKNAADRRQLESIIHPLVTADRDDFLAESRSMGALLVVLDVPLLYETGGDAACDFVILCDADSATQRDRGMARSGMTEQKWDAILASQMPMEDKRARADAVIETQYGLEAARRQLDEILDRIRVPDASRNAAARSTGVDRHDT